MRRKRATHRTGLLDAARPTAVNLSWATGRVLRVARVTDPGDPAPEIAERLLVQAHALREEDERICLLFGEHGAVTEPRGF